MVREQHKTESIKQTHPIVLKNIDS